MRYTHEHEEIQRTLKRFIDDEVNPHVDAWEAAEEFPAHQVFKRLGELGLLGLTKPEKYGGMGYTWDNPVSRHFRDGRLGSIAGGADEVMLGIIAKYMHTLPTRR